MQWTWFDIRRFSDFLSHDGFFGQWMVTIGLPALVGVGFLGAALFCFKVRVTRRLAMVVLFVSLAVGCMLAIVSPWGYFATVLNVLALFCVYQRVNRE